MVKTRMRYGYTKSLEQKRKSTVTVKQNYITSNLPSIYTIFDPDRTSNFIELSHPQVEETGFMDH
jgi:hypothetical protein